MPIPIIPLSWLCTHCGASYRHRGDASRCCDEGAEQGYSCPICQAGHATASAAADCCGYAYGPAVDEIAERIANRRWAIAHGQTELPI